MRVSASASAWSILACCLISCAQVQRGPQDRIYRGICLLDFERSDFTPEGQSVFDEDGNMVSLERWWLVGDVGTLASRIGQGRPALVVLEGRLSEPGGYGHLGSYGRQLQVTKVLEVLPIKEAE